MVLGGELRMRELAINLGVLEASHQLPSHLEPDPLLSGLSCLSAPGKSSLTALSLAHSLQALGCCPVAGPGTVADIERRDLVVPSKVTQ